jgi:bacterioferritin-associated ferredoxin
MYACICRAITETDVRRAGHAGVTAPDDLIELFSLNDASCCGRCARRPERLVALAAEGADRSGPEVHATLPSTPALVAGVARSLIGTALRPR